jgi:hypothetical protein
MQKTLTVHTGLVESDLPPSPTNVPDQPSAPVVLLGEQQRLALEWLAGGGSVTEAGQYAGVCRQTVSHWLNHDADFRFAFMDLRTQARALNQARLEALAESALDTIAQSIRQKRDARVALVVLKGLGMLAPGK